ncbi:MAG: cache domain-containing protein, partial [Proteobacteria bacterium]|nr:cache domain-containing protein [Pseudomonadota bacterium]
AYQEFENGVQRQRIEYVKSQEEIIKNEVNRAVGFIEFNKAKIAKRVKAGEKPYDVKKEIQNDIVQWIQGIRFNEGGYIFLSTYDGIVLAHHRPKYIGRNLWDLTDPNGVKIHQTILKAGTEPGGGYMEYIGTKNPVTGKPGEKITFSKSIDDWKWLVGSGFYIDNIEPVIAEKREPLTERVKSQIIYAVLIFLVAGVLATLIMNIFSRRIRKHFDLLNAYFQRSVTAYEKVDKNELLYEEFRTLSDSINKTVDEHKRAEEELGRINRALKALSECTKAMVRATEESDLTHDICRIIVEVGGYRLAWVGFAEQDEAKTIRPVAQAGYEEGYLKTVNITWADTDRGRGPTGTAIRTEKPAIVKNILTDPNYTPWRAEASKRGYESGIALPLISNEQAFGALNICAEKADAFDTEEVKLLMKFADDLAYGIMALRTGIEGKRYEKELRNSEKRLAQAIQGISIPTFIIDDNHVITHWNKACEKLTGFSASEAVGTKKQWSAFYIKERSVMADFIVDGSTEEEMDERYKHIDYNKSVLIKGAYEGENFYPDLGEKGRWLFFTAAPLRDQQGKIIGAIETFQDITERRSMEEQLRQSQKMEAIGTLAGGVAHDFNNLLTVIIGNAELALMNAIKDESLRKEIEDIKKTGDKAASLTRQLLAFSRKQIIMPEVLYLNEEINNTEKILKRIIRENIELQMVLEPELWKVYADSGQINQVIMNMVINARYAMPQGGKLTIETANADLNKNYFRKHGIKETPGHYVMLTVSDTGIGMDKETQKHIFEPFFTTKEVGKGTGLGLSTVYGIVKQNNGFIWVYSEPGKGTTFNVYLPEMKEDVEPEKKEQTPVVDLSGSETVLIVEDDTRLLNLAQKVLQSYGYRILAAENGEEALKIGKQHEGSIHVMITDVVMPKMGGREAAELLQPLYPQMKVIYMSGYTDNAIVRHGVLKPGLNFLEKPFTPESLVRKVREVLGAEIPIQPIL